MHLTSRVPWLGLACAIAFSAFGNTACAPSHDESPRNVPAEQQQAPTAKDYEILYPKEQNPDTAQDTDTLPPQEEEPDSTQPTDVTQAQQQPRPSEDAPQRQTSDDFSSKKKADVSIGGADGVFTMAAIGDSISVGFDAQLPAYNKSLNWSTGNHFLGLVKSHYLRLKEIFPGKVVKYNRAKVGSAAAHVRQQMHQLTEELNGKELDYLTIMVGANDVCFWPRDHKNKLDAYEANMRATVEEAIAYNNNLKITVVPVPNMLRLYEVGKTKACSYAWRLVNMCDVLFFSHEESDRVAFGQRLGDLNDRLRAIANDYPEHIHFADKVAKASFEKDDVSDIDCFHPSFKGQQKLALDSWEGGWYDRQPSELVAHQ